MPATERKFLKNNYLRRDSLLGGDLNPILGFCFPLFSRVFLGEFPSGWKTTESSGNKSVVFCGRATYTFAMCFDYFLPFLWGL